MEATDEIAESDELISQEVSLQVLDDLLKEMTPEERLILILKYKEKQTIRDIHSSLGISGSAVKMRLKRARIKITSLLDQRKKRLS